MTTIISSLFRNLVSTCFGSWDKGLALLLIYTGLSTNSLAAIIFEDDFARGNSSTISNSWLEYENDASDVAIYNQRARLRDEASIAPDARLSLDLNLNNYSNLSVRFDWGANTGTEPSDFAYFGWYSETRGYSALWTQALGGSPMENVELSLTTPSASDALLAFWIDVSAASETFYLDNFILDGDLLESSEPMASVPEPSTLGLLGAGFALLLLSRRKTEAHCA